MTQNLGFKMHRDGSERLTKHHNYLIQKLQPSRECVRININLHFIYNVIQAYLERSQIQNNNNYKYKITGFL